MLSDLIRELVPHRAIVWDKDTQEHWVLEYHEGKPLWISADGTKGLPFSAITNVEHPRFSNTHDIFGYIAAEQLLAAWHPGDMMWKYLARTYFDNQEELEQLEDNNGGAEDFTNYLDWEEMERLTEGWQE